MQASEAQEMLLWLKKTRTKKSNQKEKRMHQSHLDPKSFPLHSLKFQFTRKNFLAIYMAFLEFAHILWETSKRTIV